MQQTSVRKVVPAHTLFRNQQVLLDRERLSGVSPTAPVRLGCSNFEFLDTTVADTQFDATGASNCEFLVSSE